jgi:F0F1-type ATP synthase assembly protein I
MISAPPTTRQRDEGPIDKRMIQQMSSYSYVGIFFGIAICLGLGAGRWADRRWHTDPWLTIAGIILGVAAGFVELYKVSKKALKDEEK